MKTPHPQLYQWWVNETNYVQVTRPCFAGKCRFPDNYFVPGQLQRSFRTVVDSFFPKREVDPYFETRLAEACKICFKTLATRLGQHAFFGGRQPGQLDAFVFGYLAPILKVTFPGFNALQLNLKEHPTLTQFVGRLLARCFPEQPTQTQPEAVKSSAGLGERVSYADLLFSGIVATLAMVGYALATGILQIQTVNEEEEEPADDAEYGAGYSPPVPILELPPDMLLPSPGEYVEEAEESDAKVTEVNEAPDQRPATGEKEAADQAE